MRIKKILALLLTIIAFNINILYSQERDVNYDEAKVAPYSLPSILTSNGGSVINNINDWEQFRKPEISYSFINHIYGRVPGQIDTMLVKVNEEGDFLNGAARRKQTTLTFVKNNRKLDVQLLIYLPVGKDKPALFVGYNFQGNHTIANDKEILITKSWVPVNKDIGVESNAAVEQSRGSMSRRWPLEFIIESGYGVATLYRGDVDPDKDDFGDGIHELFYEEGQTKPKADEWGTIAAWSWALSRVMDYLITLDEIDSNKVIVIGHSRLGKVALWTAATDNRFAGCISNNSGEMGAALSRRSFGETVEVINNAFPHWFCGNFKKYSNKEYMLPVDQHMLISLIAPRPVYVASATDDLWADPKGEFLSVKEASIVYNMYGIPALSSTSMPQANSPIIGEVGYHLRTGKHDITMFDWEQYVKFAKYNNIE